MLKVKVIWQSEKTFAIIDSLKRTWPTWPPSQVCSYYIDCPSSSMLLLPCIPIIWDWSQNIHDQFLNWHFEYKLLLELGTNLASHLCLADNTLLLLKARRDPHTRMQLQCSTGGSTYALWFLACSLLWFSLAALSSCWLLPVPKSVRWWPSGTFLALDWPS